MSTVSSAARRSVPPVLVAFLCGWLLAALLPAPTTTATAAAVTATATYSVAGSVEQVYALGLPPKAKASLLDPTGHVETTQESDPLGGVLFRDVPPGSGYRVREDASGQESPPVTVHTPAPSPWDPSVYDQSIPTSGYGYLTTRDGTKLAIDVHLPSQRAATYPTLIEYAGYGYADPAGPDSGIAVLANLMGFAVVDVNMRGTGCSGGAFDYFEPLQDLDGYDIVETVAHQPWVLGHKVGMMGLSYGAISQLFTAQTDPPDLEAISPLSTIDATASTLYPGGILNTGFATGWAQGRQHDAEAAGPQNGQAWAYQRIQGGDATCAANQALHGEAADLSAKIAANTHYDAAVADPLDPVSFVHKIKVPVFLACQWEDEQTGGQCPELVRHFTGTKKKWFTFTNGAHIDSLDPATFDRWYDFLELYVAHRSPQAGAAALRALAPVIYRTAMGLPSGDNVELPADPIQQIPSYGAALAAFEAQPAVRVLFDNGAGQPAGLVASAGDPYAGFEQSFSTYPVPSAAAQTWYLGPGGTLAAKPSDSSGVDQYTSDASALPLTDYSGSNTETGGLWSNASAWQWNWQQNPAGTAVSYVTAPLTTDTTVVGGGAVDLWIRSSTPDVDLQATISEVRPDGNETFVQNGWLRASDRALSTSADDYLGVASTPVDPVPSLKPSDVASLPTGRFVKVVIPLYDEGHVYRTGSRIRVTISAPNGTQPVWSFSQTKPSGTATVSIAHAASMPSNLVLPVVAGVKVPTPLPACPSLRNEPCRPYRPIANTRGS
ncbi:MAG TPA: CocE/NonD family hydrolase [Acidimicrobiales bacterium]|jgi:predicted acyl esterase|nr:CocE/NonD family hydrolase [Acidimicrobiales bacterium]